MGEMEQSGRIRFLATYAQGDTPGSIQLVERVPIGSDQDVERFRLLNEQSRVAAERLGSERIESGFAIRYHHNGREYVVAPYEEWGIEILRDSLQSLRVRDRSLGKRDRIVWSLWHYRNKAVISMGRLDSKIAAFRWKCAECGHARAPMRYPQGCPKCGSRRYRDITGTSRLEALGRITKAALRRRFKISERHLARILSAELEPVPGGADSARSVPPQPASLQ
jgi:predicted Zn-ribbon and HTH transcriptional regulator